MRNLIILLTSLLAAPSAWAQCNVSITQNNATCNSSCNGSATAISSGQPPFAYSWSPVNQFTQTATGLCAGTYTVYVTDVNNCTGSAVVVIGQPPAMTTTFSNVTMALCNNACNGSATVIVSGGIAPYTYLWPNSQVTATATGLCAGTYTVMITDAGGCTVTNSVTITQPTAITVNPSQTNVDCYGSCNGSASVTNFGGTPPYTFQWAPGGQTTSAITGLCAGIYTCVVTDANSCTGTAVFTISQPPPLTLSATVTSNVICSNTCSGSASLNPSGGTPTYSYAWSNGQTFNSATALCAGNYSAVVTDVNGCTAQASVTLSPAPLFYDSIVSTGATCLSCADGLATAYPVGGTGPYAFAWSNGQTTYSATGLLPGTYSVTITEANGCTTSNVVTIENGNSCNANFYSYPDTSNFNTLYVVNMAGGALPLTYTWNWGDGSPDDYTAYPTHTYTSSGTYSICLNIADNLGCSSSFCNAVTVARAAGPSILSGTTVYVIAPPVMTGTEETGSTISWNIYPNPSKGDLNLVYSLKEAASVQLDIFSPLGDKVVNLISSENESAGEHLLHIPALGLPAGIYLLRLRTGEKAETRRMILMNE